MKSKMRVGVGYDVHPLAPGRRMVLGGIDIPYGMGFIGWSDGDALTHAIIDALLGAAALGDIGRYFPPGDPQYKGISSLVLLKIIRDELTKQGWQIANVDATIVLEMPRLSGFIDRIRQQLSQMMGIDISRVSVKATTSEHLGFAGRGEGIAVYAVALIEGSDNEGI